MWCYPIPSDFEEIGTDDSRLSAFRAVVDEHYRYHQFWGGMFFVIPIFFVGWFTVSFTAWNWLRFLSWIFLFTALEFLTGYGAAVGLQNYVNRGQQILRGDDDAKRLEKKEKSHQKEDGNKKEGHKEKGG